MRVYLCLTQEHDLRFVLLAGLICLFGAYTALSVLHRAVAGQGRARMVWLAASAIAAGGATWATHFVAMLSYRPVCRPATISSLPSSRSSSRSSFPVWG